MFGLFENKKKERINNAISTIIHTLRIGFAPITNDCNIIPKTQEKAINDQLIIAYIYGAASAGIHFLNFRGDNQTTTTILINVFDYYFPGFGSDLTMRCTEIIERDAEDKVRAEFMSIVKKAFEETKSFYETDGVLLPSPIILLEHLRENYDCVEPIYDD